LISVIIVNYNVKYFLERSLLAVREALVCEPGEIIVFDNASADGSKEYLEPKFPEVRFIWNDENLGFGRANNKAWKQAKGNIILFLNPDTLIGRKCLSNTAGFLRSKEEAGALGIRMINGSGRFLKESKRGYPTVMTSFYKLCGLSSLFPRSSVFARYYLGHLDPDQTQEIDVLAGAFMMVKREVLEKTGGFDEDFFMYGEDIDLSYRIQQLGYKNYYFADDTIVHFKGESTRRDSLNYIRMFYSAMIIFVRKHYKGIPAILLRTCLYIAISVRAVVALFSLFLHRFFPSKERFKPMNKKRLVMVGEQEDADCVSTLFTFDQQSDSTELLPRIPSKKIRNVLSRG
jgi:GT2 family glycosyltransferase